MMNVMVLWAWLTFIKIVLSFSSTAVARNVVEAILILLAAFILTGLPAFLLGYALGTDEMEKTT